MKGKNMCLSFGSNVIFNNASFMVDDNDKVAVVGVNGSGKSTLFKVLINEESLDSGSIELGKLRIGYLPQEIKIGDFQTAIDYIKSGRPIASLEKRLTQLYMMLENVNDDYDSIYRKIELVQKNLESYDYFNYESQLEQITNKLNLSASILNMPIKNLSGGQKSRVAFARLLYSKYDSLLLDEPTNHLDSAAKEFVLNYLKKFKGLVLIISHDIDFLNKLVNKTMYLNKANHKIYVFNGDYDYFLKKYEELEYATDKLIQRQEHEIDELAKFVAKAQAATRTNHHLKAMGNEREQKLLKLQAQRIEKEQKYGRIHIDITPRFAPARVPLEVNNVSFGYENYPILFKNVSFNLVGNEKFLIVGPNGIGKSTLLKVIMNKLKPLTGSVHIDNKTDYAYYAQEMETLDFKKNILENVSSMEYTETQIRSILGNFLFFKDDVYKKINTLSPGERARVMLCKLLLSKPNMLILDEPTNHLDPDTQKIIGENFNEFKGTILMVSHNPSFVEAVGITRMLILPDCKIEKYSHDLLMYYHEINTKD